MNRHVLYLDRMSTGLKMTIKKNLHTYFEPNKNNNIIHIAR